MPDYDCAQGRHQWPAHVFKQREPDPTACCLRCGMLFVDRLAEVADVLRQTQETMTREFQAKLAEWEYQVRPEGE